MHRPAHAAGLALGIERCGFGQSIGIELDDRVERRTSVVDRFDAVEVGLGQGDAAELAPAHACLQLADVQLGEFEAGSVRSGAVRCFADRPFAVDRDWRLAAACQQTGRQDGKNQKTHGDPGSR